MGAPDPTQPLREEIERRWQGLAGSTERVDETRARGAITALYEALTGRPPRAILTLPSPYACHLAATLVRGDFPSKTLESLLLWPQLQASRLQLADLPSEEIDRAATEIDRSVAAGYRRCLGAALQWALGDFGRTPAASHDVGQISPYLSSQLPHLEKPDRDQIFRDTPRPKRQMKSDEGVAYLDATMGRWLGRLAVDEFLTAGQTTHQPCNDCIRDALREACKACGWFWLHPEVALIADRPEALHLDSEGRAHAEDGPAIRYSDGFSIFAIHGVGFTSDVVLAPHTISVADIESELNAERRRLLIERMGAERYLRESRAEKVHQDETGILWRRTYQLRRPPYLSPISSFGRRAPTVLRTQCFVEVINGTPEGDGTRKRYFLRVPPEMRTARQAVAWTYGLSESEYVPETRT